jgi:Fic family protein
MSSDERIRHSKAREAEIVSDPEEQAKVEALNGVRQFDAVTDMIEHFSDLERKFKLRPSHLLHLQRIALDSLSSYAGNYRPAGIEIGGSRHKPPGAHTVPEEIEHMCDYVNDNWEKSSPVH